MDRIGDKIRCNPSVKLQKGNLYPFIDMEKIRTGTKYITGFDYASYEGQSCSKFCSGDTIMARITPCLENGKIAQYKTDSEKAFGSTEFFVFRGIPNITDSNYVYYLISAKYIRDLATNSMTGASGRQRADVKFIKKIKWKFPDLPTQQRIADILSTYDDLIENNNKRITLLERAAQELYKEWFVRFRFPGHETTKFVNGLPEGWTRKKISEFYNTCSGGTPSRSKPEYYENGVYPWVKTGEIKDSIIIDAEEYITENAIINSSAKLLPAKSVVMAMYGVNIGMLAYFDQEMACNQACCVFSDKRKFSSRHYLFQYLLSIREYLLLIGFGAAQQNLSQDLIKRVKILMPTDGLITAFEKKVDDYYESTRNLMMRNQNLAKQRDLLLPRLMSGKLEV